MLEEKEAGGRIRLARAVEIADPNAAAELAAAPGFDPVGDVLVESSGFPTSSPTPLGPAGSGREGEARVLLYSPEALEVETRSGTPCTLFVADAFAQGWSATLDGIPAQIVPADIAGRAVALPAGQHRVRMEYRTPGLRVGLALSGFGYLLIAGFLLRWQSREDRIHTNEREPS